MKKIMLALDWHWVRDNLRTPCGNTLFIIKFQKAIDDKKWAVVHYDATNDQGMKVLEKFYHLESAVAYAKYLVS